MGGEVAAVNRGLAGPAAGVAPVKLVVGGIAREVGAVAQGGLFIERVARLNHLEVAGVEALGHLDDLDLHGVALGGEGVAIAEDERDVTGPLAQGGERVAVHGGVRAGDRGQRAIADVGGAGHDVGAPLAGILREGFHLRRQPINGRVPAGLVRVADGHQRFEQGQLRRRQHVEVEIIVPGYFVMEHALEDERALGAAQRVEVKALHQRGRQRLEVSLALEGIGGDGGGNGRESRSAQGVGLFTGGIEERYAGLGGEGVGGVLGDGLLVIDLGAGLPTHLGQPVFGQRQSLADGEFGGAAGPRGFVQNGQGLIGRAVLDG